MLLCFVCFEWMLCCDVVCEKKKKVDNKKNIVAPFLALMHEQ